MIKAVNEKILFIGGWVLAALLLMGYNALEAHKLLKVSFFRNSENINMVRENHQKIMQKGYLEGKVREDRINLDHIFAKFVQNFHDQQTDIALKLEKKKVGEKEKDNVKIPELEGILKSSDIYGNIHLLAIIEGMICSKEDRVHGFTVCKITDKGIDLTKDGKYWFIPSPEVKFSLDKGG